MSALPLACHPLAHNDKPEVNRPMVNFGPGLDSNHFIHYTPDEDEVVLLASYQRRVEDLKEEVRSELMAGAGKPSQQLKFIDAMQRLGVAYHFEEEIEKALRNIYDTHNHGDDKYEDLYYVSLRFRLLRQQGYNISCDVFKIFKDENDCFKECLIKDVKGMLGLYEAAHLRVQEEDILDEALAFTTTHLKARVENLDINPIAAQINRALQCPMRKRFERLEVRPNITVYQNEASHSKALLELAKLDFNQLKSLYKTELSHISRWWKDLDLSSKLPFFRDRVVESYFLIAVTCFEPQYLYARRIEAKLLAIIAIIDDMYDAYGSPEELELFTKAIERWDDSSIDILPEYMQPCYQAILGVFKEIEEKENEERSYSVRYAKETMKTAVRAYHAEATWFHGKYIPTVEEYLSVALVSIDVTLFTTICFVGMGKIATVEAFDWVLKDPVIMRASSTIVRLMDDMASHKFEQERGHMASIVECYMKQHGVSEQLAYQELNKQVENAWKDVNQGCLKPTAISMHLINRVLNFARIGEFMYRGRKDIFTNAEEMYDNIASLLIDPLPL